MMGAAWQAGNFRAIVILGIIRMTGHNEHSGSSERHGAPRWVLWRQRETLCTLGVVSVCSGEDGWVPLEGSNRYLKNSLLRDCSSPDRGG